MLDLISGIAGALLSLLFSYAPPVQGWFEALEATQKRLVMLGLLLLSAVLVFVLACSGLAAEFGLSATCDRAGIIELVKAFLAAMVVNQATWLLSPKPEWIWLEREDAPPYDEEEDVQ